MSECFVEKEYLRMRERTVKLQVYVVSGSSDNRKMKKYTI